MYNGVKTSILRKSIGNNPKSFGKSFEAVRIGSGQGVGEKHKLPRIRSINKGTQLLKRFPYLEISISGAPPPAMRNLFITRQRMAYRASCKDQLVGSPDDGWSMSCRCGHASDVDTLAGPGLDLLDYLHGHQVLAGVVVQGESGHLSR